MMRRIATSVLLVALGGGLLVGSSIVGPASAGTEVAVGVVFAPGPPPAAPVEVVGVRPAPGWVWIRGYYAWHERWVWRPGYWARVPVGYATWVPGYWAHRPAGWVWVEGRWH
jgi:hypothetical protein